jgi:hypothetical protein
LGYPHKTAHANSTNRRQSENFRDPRSLLPTLFGQLISSQANWRGTEWLFETHQMMLARKS